MKKVRRKRESNRRNWTNWKRNGKTREQRKFCLGSLVRMNHIFIHHTEIKSTHFFFNIGACKVFYGFILLVRYLCLIFRAVCCHVNLSFLWKLYSLFLKINTCTWTLIKQKLILKHFYFLNEHVLDEVWKLVWFFL